MSVKQQLALNFFNETVIEFLQDLLRLYPKDTILTMAFTGIKLYMKSSSIGIHDAFKTVFGPYFDQILLKDEAFFLEHTSAEYKEDYKRMKKNEKLLNEIKEVKEQYKVQKQEKSKSMFDSIITKLKSEWKEMNSDNKKIIWDYVNQLVQLSQKIV
jgi:hypothetical protein